MKTLVAVLLSIVASTSVGQSVKSARSSKIRADSKSYYDTASAYAVIKVMIEDYQDDKQLYLLNTAELPYDTGKEAQFLTRLYKHLDSSLVKAINPKRLQTHKRIWLSQAKIKNAQLIDSLSERRMATLIRLKSELKHKDEYNMSTEEQQQAAFQVDSLTKLLGMRKPGRLLHISLPIFISPSKCLVEYYAYAGPLNGGGGLILLVKDKAGKWKWEDDLESWSS